jgi:hypothetical protein
LLARNRRGRAYGKLVAVRSFQIESEAGLRIDERRCTAELNLFEQLRIAFANRTHHALVGSRVHFSDAVVN